MAPWTVVSGPQENRYWHRATIMEGERIVAKVEALNAAPSRIPDRGERTVILLASAQEVLAALKSIVGGDGRWAIPREEYAEAVSAIAKAEKGGA